MSNVDPPVAWEAWVAFKRGHMLYDRLHGTFSEAWDYRIAYYAHRADEDICAEEWLSIEGIEIKRVYITLVE